MTKKGTNSYIEDSRNEFILIYEVMSLPISIPYIILFCQHIYVKSLKIIFILIRFSILLI